MTEAAARSGALTPPTVGSAAIGGRDLPRIRRPIRVATVDDHQLVRQGLRLVLAGEDDIEVVGEGGTKAEAFEIVASTRPDVLLLDLTLADGDAMSLVRELHATYPATRVLVLTMHRSPETVRQALLAGARGYLVKGAHSGELVQAIHAVDRGERYVHSSVTDIIVEDSIRLYHGDDRMSVREREILGLIAAGVSPADVGRRLGISVFTVRRHVANLSGKLGLRGTAALVRYAVEHDLVRDP